MVDEITLIDARDEYHTKKNSRFVTIFTRNYYYIFIIHPYFQRTA